MADIPVTFDIGGGVSAATSVMTFVQGLLTGSRSVTVEVDNNTALTLVRKGWHHYHGGFVKFPADRIGPYNADGKGCVDVFGSQNKGGSIMTGTEGWVSYYGHETTQTGVGRPILFLRVAWDNAYVGGNKAKVQLAWSHDYRLRYAGGSGNTLAAFRFQLYSGDQMSLPETLDISDTGEG